MGDGDKIGAARHTGRNVGVILGVLLLAGGIYWFQMSAKKANEGKMVDLEAFRAAYAKKCDAPAFQGETPAQLRDAYLSSNTLPQTVSKQLALLGSGSSCEEVTRALKAADFPMMATAKTPN
jgi:hypothetical protein